MLCLTLLICAWHHPPVHSSIGLIAVLLATSGENGVGCVLIEDACQKVSNWRRKLDQSQTRDVCVVDSQRQGHQACPTPLMTRRCAMVSVKRLREHRSRTGHPEINRYSWYISVALAGTTWQREPRPASARERDVHPLPLAPRSTNLNHSSP